jgi:hemolysin activation/secretion protein
MFVTLWHEMLHAIDDVAGTGLSEDKINRLAPILAGVLIDNGYVRSDATEG